MNKARVHRFGLQRDNQNRYTIKLFDGRLETDDDIKLVTVWACVDHNGDVLLESFDAGEFDEVRQILGNYNRTVRVEAADRDKLLLLLMREVFAGEIKGARLFKEFAEESGIEVKTTQHA